jgi:hypothetical protein
MPLVIQTGMFLAAIVWATLMFIVLPNPGAPNVKVTWEHAVATTMFLIGIVGMVNVVGVGRLIGDFLGPVG